MLCIFDSLPSNSQVESVAVEWSISIRTGTHTATFLRMMLRAKLWNVVYCIYRLSCSERFPLPCSSDLKFSNNCVNDVRTNRLWSCCCSISCLFRSHLLVFISGSAYSDHPRTTSWHIRHFGGDFPSLRTQTNAILKMSLNNASF